jgi:transcriptional regulator with XRE-family HTH domain
MTPKQRLAQLRFRGQRLRALRHTRALSAAELARRTGLTTHHIYRLERNARPHTRGTTVARLAVALRTSTDYLLGLTDEPAVPEGWAAPGEEYA